MIRPIKSVSPPVAAQKDEPVIILPGRTLMPCRSQIDPKKIMMMPMGMNTIFLFILNLESSDLGGLSSYWQLLDVAILSEGSGEFF